VANSGREHGETAKSGGHAGGDAASGMKPGASADAAIAKRRMAAGEVLLK